MNEQQIAAMKMALEALRHATWDEDYEMFAGIEAEHALENALRQALEPKTRPATREEKIVRPGVYEVPVEQPCKYPKCSYPCPDLPDCTDAEQQPAESITDFKNRLATAIEAMPFGDTAASFAVYIREFK